MDFNKIAVLTQAKIWSFINWRRSYYIILIESVLYLVLFGAGFSRLVGSQTVNGHLLTYQQFLFAGLVAIQSFRVFPYLIFTSSNDVKWGMYRLFVLTGLSPLEYLLARGVNAWIYMLAQWVLLIFTGLVVIGPFVLLPGLIMAIVSIPGVLFWSCLGAIIGTLIRDYGTRDLISSVVVLPVVFSSTALYSVDNAPTFLKVLSTLNPLTYQANSLRLAYIGSWGGMAANAGILLLCAAVLYAFAQYILPRADLAGLQRG